MLRDPNRRVIWQTEFHFMWNGVPRCVRFGVQEATPAEWIMTVGQLACVYLLLAWLFGWWPA